MPNVHLLTDLNTDLKNTEKSYYFDAGDLVEIVNKHLPDEIEYLKDIAFDNDLLEKNSGLDENGAPRAIYSIAIDLARKMKKTYAAYIDNAPDDIYFVFKNPMKFGLLIDFLIKDIMYVMRKKYNARGTSKSNYDSVTQTITKAINGDEEDDEDEDEDHYMAADDGNDEDLVNEYDDDIDGELAENQLEDNLEDYEREKEAESFRLPNRMYEPILSSEAYTKLLKESPIASKVNTKKIDPENPSYRISDQGNIHLMGRMRRTVWFVKKPISRSTPDVYVKNFSSNMDD